MASKIKIPTKTSAYKNQLLFLFFSIKAYYAKLNHFSSIAALVIEKKFRYYLQYIIPFHCVFCDRYLPYISHGNVLLLCSQCKVHYLQPDASMHILQSQKFFTHLNLFLYDDACRNSLIKAKFQHSPADAHLFSQALLNELCLFFKSLKNSKMVHLCHVPGVQKRLKQRKFDLLHYCCKKIADTYDLDFSPLIIQRIRDTAQQKYLSLNQRKHNLKGAFKIPEKVKGKTIILLDDIYTSGSTVSYISHLLYQKKAKRVFVITLALRP